MTEKISPSFRSNGADVIEQEKRSLHSPTDLPKILNEQAYFAYSYSYPHKSAYGPLSPTVPLHDIWQAENRNSLFLYVHIPFCEMRCGFCNLFTRAGGEADYNRYLDALDLQMLVMSQCTSGEREVRRLAFGGGTPTVLSIAQLQRLFDQVEHHFHATPAATEAAIETSPKTATPERMKFLRQIGVSRVSIGVQSFLDSEAHSIGRPQKASEVKAALDTICNLEFPALNIDLIYGQPNQTVASWMESIETTLSYAPQEIFLYPLYIRPETGIAGKRQSSEQNIYRQCYREARDRLLDAGYEQFSMRSFRKFGPSNSLINEPDKPSSNGPAHEGPVYCCQEDGMLGLGCGARSYTQRLHYSSPFAVQMAKVHTILENWMQQSREDISQATWGVWLDENEQQRRFIIQSLLNQAGLDEHRFTERFGVTPLSVVPELGSLLEHGYLEAFESRWRLTPIGMELSDSIGPFLYSDVSRQSIKRFIQ